MSQSSLFQIHLHTISEFLPVFSQPGSIYLQLAMMMATMPLTQSSGPQRPQSLTHFHVTTKFLSMFSHRSSKYLRLVMTTATITSTCVYQSPLTQIDLCIICESLLIF